MLISWTTLPGWQAVGWTMIHFLWIGSLIALITLVGRMALYRCRPQMRYVFLVGCFVLLAVAPWPVLWHLLHAPALAYHHASASIEQTVATSSADASLGVESVALVLGSLRVGASVPPVSQAGQGWHGIWETYLGRVALIAPWLWLVGTPLSLLLVSCGFVGTRHLRRSTQTLSEPWVIELADRLRLALNLGREVAVGIHEAVASPVLIGVIKPMILLPPALIGGCTTEQLEMVLLHELAHIGRWDPWGEPLSENHRGFAFLSSRSLDRVSMDSQRARVLL